MSKWWLLGGAIVSEVAATMALRATVDDPMWLPVVVIGYVTAFVLLGLTLRTGIPIGAAYGIWGASGVALAAALGVVLFAEVLSPMAIVGIALVIVGLVLVETGSPGADVRLDVAAARADDAEGAAGDAARADDADGGTGDADGGADGTARWEARR